VTWDPLSPPEVAALFDGHGPWWLAGGYAIERFVGRTLRPHGDIDVLVLRRDQLRVQEALADWEWWAADPPGTLRPWLPDEVLEPQIHDIWCRPGADEPWRVQVMLDESEGPEWVSRRDPRVRRADFWWDSNGIPCVRPEILLFYKAKDTRPKDEVDFAATLPLLDEESLRWLRSAVRDTYGTGQPGVYGTTPRGLPLG
jgi:hypothetical protein